MPKSLAKLGQETLLNLRNKTAVILPKPQEGLQQFVHESDIDVIICGSGAGTGKSMAALLKHTRFIENKDYTGTIFRRTLSAASKPGSIIDASRRIYPLFGGRYNGSTYRWTFPSGATVSFPHLQYDATKEDYMGAEITGLIFDELTTFLESQFWFMFSRNRSISGIKPFVIATCNPDPNSWVKKLILWYLDEKQEYPDPKKAGIVRYFYRNEDDLEWGSSYDELFKQYIEQRLIKDGTFKGESLGKFAIRLGKDWVKANTINALIKKVKANQDLSRNIPITSFTFLPGNIYDNSALLDANPQYISRLENLHPIERERLLKGNWLACYEAGTIFDRAWFDIIEQDELPDLEQSVIIRFWDFAATGKEQATKRSSYTAGCKMAKISDDLYIILDLITTQIKGGEIENLVQHTADLDGTQVFVRAEKEGGSSGKILEEQFEDNLREKGIDYEAVSPQGSKLQRALPLATASHKRKIKLLRASWNDDFLNAVTKFDGVTTQPLISDAIDATDGAYNELRLIEVAPPLPDFSESSGSLLSGWV
jgi:predicted phage terminase large subunit-like protein